MATTEPLTGLTANDQSDPAQGGLQVGSAVKGLAPFTVPRFASATARDSAWGNWLASQPAGTKIPDGATCRLASDSTLWRYDQTHSLWTWDMGSQGLLGSASYNGSNTGLADAPGTIAAFNITGLNIPARRNIELRLRLAGAPSAANSFSAYGFVMYLNGVATGQRIHYTNTYGYGAAANFASSTQVSTALSSVGANVTGSLYAGVSYTLVAGGVYGSATFSVVDLGGY